MSRVILLTAISLMAFSLSSCKKRRLNRDTTTSIDASIIEGAFNDIQKIAEYGVKEQDLGGRSGFRSIYGNPTIALNPAWPDTTFPKVLTIDFGSGTTDNFGVTRKGLLTITCTGLYRDSAASFSMVPANYHVNEYKIEGTKTVVNKGRNAAGNLWFTVDIDNARVTDNDGLAITWESSRQREWVYGESTNWLNNGLNGVLDDTYAISGNANGINREGRAYTINITNDLIVSVDCRYIKEGTLTLTPEDLDVRTVDYGNGSCDNQATVEINGRTYDIVMW